MPDDSQSSAVSMTSKTLDGRLLYRHARTAGYLYQCSAISSASTTNSARMWSAIDQPTDLGGLALSRRSPRRLQSPDPQVRDVGDRERVGLLGAKAPLDEVVGDTDARLLGSSCGPA